MHTISTKMSALLLCFMMLCFGEKSSEHAYDGAQPNSDQHGISLCKEGEVLENPPTSSNCLGNRVGVSKQDMKLSGLEPKDTSVYKKAEEEGLHLITIQSVFSNDENQKDAKDMPVPLWNLMGHMTYNSTEDGNKTTYPFLKGKAVELEQQRFKENNENKENKGDKEKSTDETVSESSDSEVKDKEKKPNSDKKDGAGASKLRAKSSIFGIPTKKLN